MMTSSLLDDISSELLVCRICSGALRRAKTLSCRHSFCQTCLQRLRDADFSADFDDDDSRARASRRTSSAVSRRPSVGTGRLVCPVCHESCSLPAGGVCRLPDDPVVAQLYSVIERRTQRPSGGQSTATTCEICCAEGHRPVQAKCIECGKMMCSTCVKLHRRTNVTRDHSLLDVDSVESSSVDCRHHPGESVRFYCNTCDLCVCVLCTYMDQPHSIASEHEVMSFSDALHVHQAPLAALLDDCRRQLDDARARHQAVVGLEQLIRKVEDRIHEVSTETVSQVRRRERQLVSALHELCGTACLNDDNILSDNKRLLAANVRRLDETCSAGEKLLHAVNEGSGAAAFLLQHRRTVDAMTSSMTTSQTSDVINATNYERHVRFEPYGLDSDLGLHVGRLVVDDDNDMTSRPDQQRRQLEQLATDEEVTVRRREEIGCGGSDCVEMTVRDAGVQTDEMKQVVSATSRCEASGSVPMPSTRFNARHGLMSGTMDTSPASGHGALTRAAVASSQTRDASTTTPVMKVVNASTITDCLQTTEQCVNTDVICHNQETCTSLIHVQHRSIATDLAPLTADKSTSTIPLSNECQSSDMELEARLDADTTTDDKHFRRTTNVATSSGEQRAATISDHTVSQNEHTRNIESGTDLSTTSAQSTSPSSDVVARLERLAASSSTASSSSASARLVALLPEIARTADVLAASHVSPGLTARLLGNIVDVGLELTSASSVAGTDTHPDDDASSVRCDVKTTQTDSVQKVERGVGDSQATVCDTATTANISTTMFDKETSTSRVHQINKNVATDSVSTADKQTWMPVDVATAYLSSAAAASRRVVSVSRATSTPASFIASSSVVDRATSPVRAGLVDKAVMASKADALQPLDTFQAPGQLPDPASPRSRRTLSLSPRSKLACISETADDEDTEECSDERAKDVLLSPQQKDASPRSCKQAQLPLTSTSLWLDPAHAPSSNVFNFDHAVTSRLVDD